MRRTVFWGGAALILTVLLAAAAYTAVHLWVTQRQSLAGADQEPVARVSDDGRAVSLTSRIERAAELPDREADAAGIFVRRQDNAFVIGTGTVHMNVDTTDPERPVVASHEGPEIEIVANRDTIIYRDETEVAGQSGTVQQVVKRVDSLEEIGELTYISAWGPRRGDRLTAELLVYSLER